VVTGANPIERTVVLGPSRRASTSTTVDPIGGGRVRPDALTLG
jgi:hypothetical protein